MVLSTHLPCRQILPFPHGVPSTAGSFLVRHTIWPWRTTAHQRRAQTSMPGHTEYSGPNVRLHCCVASYICPGSSSGPRICLRGRSSKQLPERKTETDHCALFRFQATKVVDLKVQGSSCCGSVTHPQTCRLRPWRGDSPRDGAGTPPRMGEGTSLRSPTPSGLFNGLYAPGHL